MNTQINYNIDSVETIRQHNKAIMVISGWTKRSDETEVEIELDKKQNWMLYRFWREDVTKNNPENRCGFYLYMWMEKFETKIRMMLTDGEDSVNVSIPIMKELAKVKLKNVVKKQQAAADLPFLMSGENWNIKYCIDSIYYNSEAKKINLMGWCLSQNGATDITVNQKGLGKQKRKDVAEAFKLTSEADGYCGFKEEVALSEDADSCHIFFVDQAQSEIQIHYTLECLEHYVKLNGVETAEGRSIVSKIKEIYPNWVMRKTYGKEGALYKKREYDIWKHENDLNTMDYQWKEISIPDEYIQIQKKKPLISVLCAIDINEENEKSVLEMIRSIDNQQYKQFEIVFAGSDKYESIVCKENPAVKYVVCQETTQQECLKMAFAQAAGDWFCIVEQEDVLSRYFLSVFVENINENESARIVYQDYDVWYKGKAQLKIQRTETFAQDENLEMAFVAVCFNKSYINDFEQLGQYLRTCDFEFVVHDQRVTYHYNAVPGVWGKTRTKMVAFYLTQYHITEENNKWWGEGFTEWSNVKRGIPMFEGHDQPRVPRELGYYDLVEDRSVQYKQIELAKQFDIFGYCYYYYWFEGKRLLRKPLDQFVEDPNLDFPYCICWANETWSKRWDGQDSEILMQQVHNKDTDIAFIKDVIPMFQDKRYIRIDGKPVLLIYRINLFPEPYKTIQRWKQICMENGVGDIHVSIVQSFGMVDHRIYGADSSVEFPPHKIVGNIINDEVLPEGSDFAGNIYSYKEIVNNLSVIQKRDYHMIPCSMMRWDNTARRMKNSNIFAEFEPELYRKWLMRNHYYTKIYNKSELTFVNAWNEWAEGTYLEPDERYGTLLLEISKEVSNFK